MGSSRRIALIAASSTHLNSWLERDTVKVKCPWPGLQTRLLNLESSTMTIRPLYWVFISSRGDESIQEFAKQVLVTSTSINLQRR